MSSNNMSNLKFSNLNKNFKDLLPIVNEKTNVKTTSNYDFLNKKRAESSKMDKNINRNVNIQNKRRYDERSSISGDNYKLKEFSSKYEKSERSNLINFSQEKTEKTENVNQNKFSNKIASFVNSSNKNNSNNTSNTKYVMTHYTESKILSMSHIKQMNPKYKNFIIPVLPGTFNKN